MNTLFSTGLINYNLDSINETISKYYLTGLQERTVPAQNELSVTFELKNIIEENVHDEKKFRDKWETLLLELKLLTNKKITGTTTGLYPCFSCIVELNQEKINFYKNVQELHVFISFLGPFYSIIGIDRNKIIKYNQIFRTVNYLMVSPEEEFKEDFLKLHEFIESRISGIKFVPFFINRLQTPDLHILYTEEENKILFHALFNNQIDFNAPFIGDPYYRNEDWLKNDIADTDMNMWRVVPPKRPEK
ncbi:MAG: hypothetical protein IT249_07385 [Chitinophagaceae bacterium]|nr:hypothetical protein [Chitinophagaceae bacterium]